MDFHNDFVFFKKKEKRERKKIMSSMTDACCSVKGFNFACNTQLRYQVSAQLPCVKRRWYQAVELCGLFFFRAVPLLFFRSLFPSSFLLHLFDEERKCCQGWYIVTAPTMYQLYPGLCTVLNLCVGMQTFHFLIFFIIPISFFYFLGAEWTHRSGMDASV